MVPEEFDITQSSQLCKLSWVLQFSPGLATSGLCSGAQRFYRDLRGMEPLTLHPHFTGNQQVCTAFFVKGLSIVSDSFPWRAAAGGAARVKRSWKSVPSGLTKRPFDLTRPLPKRSIRTLYVLKQEPVQLKLGFLSRQKI